MQSTGIIVEEMRYAAHRLSGEFHYSEDRVIQIYEEEFHKLAEHARILGYLPLLTYRAVHGRLRQIGPNATS